ncbi:MAG: DoxX family protein [Pseudomonadota bacterium]
MRLGKGVILGIAFVFGTVSGLSKQMEAPQLVAIFERAGIPPEMLSLLGAAEFVLALALLFPRTRRVAAVLGAGVFGGAAYLLWPVGATELLLFSLAMVPLMLAAGFWRRGLFRREETYQGAMPLGLSNTRR